MSSNAPRIPPLAPGSRPALAALEERIARERGSVSLLYRVLLNSPLVAEGWEALLTAVRNRSSVPAPLREIVILRVATLNGARYEFEAHVAHALRAGVPAALIERLRDETMPSPSEVDPAQRTVLELTDAMTREIRVSEELFGRVRAHFDERAVIDLTATVAAYNMVSRFLVALNISH